MGQSFTIIEDFQFPNIDTIKSFLTGAPPNPMYIVRDYIDKNICEELKCVFYRIINKTNGGTRKGDFVPVLQIGATQFNKCTSDYFSDCQKTKPYINEILDSVTDKFPNNDLLLDESLQKAFKDDNIKFDAHLIKTKTLINLRFANGQMLTTQNFLFYLTKIYRNWGRLKKTIMKFAL